MFKLYADKNKLILQELETITSGSVNVYRVRFDFSEDWEGLDRTAVFRSGGETRSVLLDDTGECTIPWEVLQKPSAPLEAGAYGTRSGDTVLPTVWASLGMILAGAAPGEDAQPPTPEQWQQELDKKGDTLSYDGLNLSLLSGDKLLSTVPVDGGGGGGDIPVPGPKGDPGATFTPSVSAEGELSWSNDGGLANPDPVNIKGPRGEPGPPGQDGEPGPAGKDATINGRNVLTIQAGGNVTVTQEDGVLAIGAKPAVLSVTLTAAGWMDKVQVVTVNGISANEAAQLIQPVPALASQSAYFEAGILCTGQTADRLMFAADTTPTEDLTVYVVIQEVAE